MSNKLDFNIGVVGAGYFAQLHHQAWEKLATAQLVGVADPNRDATSACDVPRYDSLADMLADDTINVIDIVVPPDAHRAVIEEAIAGGISYIICQKPFCGSKKDAQEMVELAKAKGVSLVVHENFRFQPWYRALQSELATERFGQIYQFCFSLRPGDGQGADAYLERQPYFQTMPRFLVHETAVHFLDIFTFLFGRPRAIYADLRRLNPVIAGEDAGLIICDYDNEMRAIFDGNRLADHKAHNQRLTMGEATLESQNGTMRLIGDGSLLWRAKGALEDDVIFRCDSQDIFGGDCVYHLIAHVIDAWKNGTTPENEAASYLDIIALEEMVYHSADGGYKIQL